MIKRLKRPQILFALIIALSVPFLSGYLVYCDLADDDPYSPEAQYENDDLDDLFLLPDCQNQLKFSGSIGSNALFYVFFPEAGVFRQFPCFSYLLFPILLSQQKTPILRC